MSAPIVSRGPTGLAAAILAGGLSVTFMLVAMMHSTTSLIFLAYFCAVPLYLAGLGAGALAGILATVVGALSLYFTEEHANFSVLYIVIYGVPAMTLCRLALRYRMDDAQKVHWYPEGKFLTALTLYPCALFLLAVGAASSHPGGLLALTSEAMKEHTAQFAARFPETQPELFERAVDNAANFIPAFMAYFWIFVSIFSVGGAQYMLRQQKWSLRSDMRLINIRLPVALIYSVAVVGLAGVFAPAPYDYIGKNLSMILILPYFFAGLAVLHASLASIKHSGFVIFAFYVLMVALPMIALIVAAVGVVDQWADFRQRIFARKTTV